MFLRHILLICRFLFVAAVCAGAQACGDRGECSAPGVCRCYSGYDGIHNGCRNCRSAVHSVFSGLTFFNDCHLSVLCPLSFQILFFTFQNSATI